MNSSATKKPLLMVGNFLSETHGVRGVCEELASRLGPLGWPIITTSNRSNRAARLFDMVRTAWINRDEYAAAQVDVYSGSAFIWAEAVCWTLRQVGKPYVLTLHGGNLPAFSRRWPGRVRRLLESAEVVTAPSEYLYESLRSFREDIKIQPNPLELKSYQFRLRERPRPLLVWLRAFHKMYNPTLAIEVLAALKPDFPEIKLTMIGPDKGDGSLQSVIDRAEQLQVTKCLNLVGAVPKADVPKHLNVGDIFLNTTNVDNTPVSVLEAMACGLCVVSTSVGGMPYLLENESNALLVPVDDASAMAESVR
ncbi:MAG TPA: glycosyltransferase family 4 protein, partial [Blastocatellia bacterium]|nr:glycosyltransferase family 4 protein [Blastocatellia bacterium]